MALTGYVSGQIIQSVPTRGVMKVDAFTASGTWTVPAGVTYAVAHILGGGGGAGTASSGNGGTSSVAFAGGTVSATGGQGVSTGSGASAVARAGAANSGKGALFISDNSGTARVQFFGTVMDGTLIVAGDAVTPAASITVTVGAGGVAGTSGAAGGSGYVYIEYLGN